VLVVHDHSSHPGAEHEKVQKGLTDGREDPELVAQKSDEVTLQNRFGGSPITAHASLRKNLNRGALLDDL
jgi:hypothetical protein